MATVISPHLTEQQLQALATDQNISVTAGAGSGKTTILVDRFLKLVVEEKISVHRVLAITFTEKAAAEMTERVARKINALLNQPQPTRLRSRLLYVRERLNSAQISTIHGFCSRLLRENAVASGIDPDAVTMNEYQRSLLMEEAVQTVIQALDHHKLESAYSEEEWREFLRQYPVYKTTATLLAGIQNAYELEKTIKRFSEESDAQIMDGLHQAFFEVLHAEVDKEVLQTSLDFLLPQLVADAPQSTDLSDNGARAFRLIRKLNGHFPGEKNSTGWQELIELALLMTTNERQPYKTTRTIGLKKVLGTLVDPLLALSHVLAPLATFADNFSATVPGRLDELHLKCLRMLFELQRKVLDHYQQAKSERGLLDFDDLQVMALNMLTDRESLNGEIPEVTKKIAERYQYVMVDEFQDTNQLQWDIISCLGKSEEGLDGKKFFVVGDPKQSIYGFRGADVRVFQQVKNDFSAIAKDKPRDGNLVLEDSFRFLDGLNHFVNEVFQITLQEDSQNPFEVGYDPLTTLRKTRGKTAIEVALFDHKQLKEEDLGEEDYIARRIYQLIENRYPVYHRSGDRENLEPLRPGDIAILIPRRNRLLTLENRLRQQGIPFKTIGGIGFYQRQEVYDVYHLLRFLANREDDMALVALLRSPFCNISDVALYLIVQLPESSFYKKLQAFADFDQLPEQDQKALPIVRRQLQRWQNRRDRLSLSRLLEDIFAESFYRATVAAEWNGEQLLANLNKIIQQAQDYEQSGFLSLTDFIDSLHQLIHQDPREGEAQIALEDENTVKIMTIHQAKGLEFPIIFCPYLDQPGNYDTAPFRLENDMGLALSIHDPEDDYQAAKPFYFQWIRHRQQQKQIAENKRLFYVAVTRARDHLFLVSTFTEKSWERDSSLAWLNQRLRLDPENLQEGPIVWEGDADLNLVISIPTREVYHKSVNAVDASLTAIESEISNARETSIPLHLQKLKTRPAGVTFSATQLMTFANDPALYFQRYHLGFFESDYEFLSPMGDAENLTLLKGKIVHTLLETAWPAAEADIKKRLRDVFYQYEIFDPETKHRLESEIPPMINRFYQSDQAKRIWNAAESKAEVSLTMQLGEDFFTGTLDRIFVNESGLWEVADYKTNAISADKTIATAGKYRMQFRSYALLLSRLYPDQQEFPVSFHFLNPDTRHQEVFHHSDIHDIEKEFLDIITKIKQYFPFTQDVPAL